MGKMQVNILLVICLLLMDFAGLASADSLRLVSGVDDFYSDAVGNTYVIRGSEIIKFNRKGIQLVSYSRKDLGIPTSLDVSNPLRIFVFYADFALIRVLDNNLIDQSEINLREMGINQPKSFAATPDQGLWIFDEILGSLLKVDSRLKEAALSVDLNQLLHRRPLPLRMLANQHWLLMEEKDHLLLFDQYGAKVTDIPISDSPRLLELRDDQLRFENNGKTETYMIRLKQFSSEPLRCDSTAKKIVLFEEKCLILKDKTLSISQ